jgi:hypothetical protein
MTPNDSSGLTELSDPEYYFEARGETNFRGKL